MIDLNIRVVGEEAALNLLVEQYITVLQMKLYIEFTYNVPHKKQKLIYESTLLKDKHTLEYYDICDGDHLALIVEGEATSMSLNVRTLTGKNFSLPVKPSWTIEELKLQLQSKEGVPIDQQRLVAYGKVLENCRTIEEYSLKNLDVLTLMIRLKGS